jgi:hypothetical protein
MKSPRVLIHSRGGIEAARELLASDRKAPTAPPKKRGGQSYFLRDESGSGPNILDPKAYRAPKDADVKAVPHDLVTVGIWSLDAWLGDLDRVVAGLNRVQNVFVFYEIEAMVPSGIVSRPERMISLDGRPEEIETWLNRGTGKPLNPRSQKEVLKRTVAWLEAGLGPLDESIRDQIAANLISNDFFPIADRIRNDFGLDYLVGVTSAMVAGVEDDEYYWNHFSTFDERTALASSYDLRDFARETGRPFEAFLVKVICSQLLVAMFFPKLYFHEDNGCMFDYDAARVTLKQKVLKPKIEDACLSRIPKKYREAAVALTNLSKEPAEFWS